MVVKKVFGSNMAANLRNVFLSLTAVLILAGCSSVEHYEVIRKTEIHETPDVKSYSMSIDKGEDVKVLSIKDGWAKVTCPAIIGTGLVQVKDLKKIEDYKVYKEKRKAEGSTSFGEDLLVIGIVLAVLLLLGGGGAKVVHLKKDGTRDRRYK